MSIRGKLEEGKVANRRDKPFILNLCRDIGDTEWIEWSY